MFTCSMFILGVGAQKSGTSWFYHQLSRVRGFKRLGEKELHFWDDLYGIRSLDFSENTSMVEFLQAETPEKCSFEGLRNGERYFERIEKKLRSGWLSRRAIVADITPAYSGLPLFVMNQIAFELESRGIDYRVVLLTRDPLARIRSAIAMNLKRLGPEKPISEGVERRGTFDDIVLRYAESWQSQFRTRYELTLSNLEAAFNPNQILVGFSEQLRTGETTSRLEEFLGVSFDSRQRDVRVNQGTQAAPWPSDLSERVARLYSPTYVAFESRFPHLRNLWAGFQYLT